MESESTKPLPSDVVFTFPVRGGGQWGLTRQQAIDYAAAFPQKDIKLEMLRAKLWLQAKPQNLKTSKGMLRFLFNWLSPKPFKGGK